MLQERVSVVSWNCEKCACRSKLVSTLSILLSLRASQAWKTCQIQLSPFTWSLRLFQASVLLLWCPPWCRWWQSSPPPPLLRTHPEATPEDTSKAGGERFLSLRRLVPLLSTAWMTSDLQHPRGKNVKSQWTLFSRLQAFCRPVQLPVSIPSKLTVKFSNGWGMTTIQLHWDRFYLRDPVCQTWRVCLQHQTDWRPLCHATVNLTAAVDVTVVKQACLSPPSATVWDSHTKTPWHWLSFFFNFFFLGLTWRIEVCWPLGRAPAKLIVIVIVTAVEQARPASLSEAVRDRHATGKWQFQTCWKIDENILWI